MCIYHIAEAPFIIAIYKSPYGFCKHVLVICAKQLQSPQQQLLICCASERWPTIAWQNILIKHPIKHSIVGWLVHDHNLY